MSTESRSPPKATAEKEDGTAADYRLEDQVGFRLRKVNQRATEVFMSVMSDYDLTAMQFAVLAKLDDLGQVSQNLLGRHVAMDPATTFGVIKRLLKRDLVEQKPDADDGRLRLIELTPKGCDLISRMKIVGAEVSQRILKPLTAAESREFLRLLAKME